MEINFKGERINLRAKRLSFIGKFIGLMFKPMKTQNLLFEFKKTGVKTIHSYFVFFPFLALWLDSKNNVLDTILVRPFTFSVSSKKTARKILEIPLNDRNFNLVELLVGKERFKYVIG